MSTWQIAALLLLALLLLFACIKWVKPKRVRLRMQPFPPRLEFDLESQDSWP
jgi:hypothetical protein